jgi:hypothetical protein
MEINGNHVTHKTERKHFEHDKKEFLFDCGSFIFFDGVVFVEEKTQHSKRKLSEKIKSKAKERHKNKLCKRMLHNIM